MAVACCGATLVRERFGDIRIFLAGEVAAVALALRFGPGDLLRCRFALSPLWETTNAIRTLAEPQRHGYHLPWLRRVQPELPPLELAPHWERIRDLLDGDIAFRARRLADGGLERLFADLDPSIRFDGDTLEVGG